MALTITDCEATTDTLTVFFSEAVPSAAMNAANYMIYDPGSRLFTNPQPPPAPPASTIAAFGPSAVQIAFPSAAFPSGDWVVVTFAPPKSSPLTTAAVVNGKNSLRIANCVATPSSVMIYFSEHLDTSQLDTGMNSDPNVAGNYTISQAGTAIDLSNATATYDPFSKATLIELVGNPLQRGQWILVTVYNVASRAGRISNGGNDTFSTRVGDGAGGGGSRHESRETTRAVEDAVAYPLLTEAVSFPASGAGSMTALTAAAGATNLDSRAALAIGDVLGWKVNGSDPRGFVGALTQAFSLTDVQGHTEASWNPRTYAVQTDLGGGITGAQASLYTRAKDAVQQSLQLLDGLYPLDPDADPEYVKALREMAKSQMNEILVQFGAVGGPSILRVNTYFEILLGQSKPNAGSTGIQFDPDQVQGTLGEVRKTYGIFFVNNPFSNSIEDEQDITNFRVISDYMTSLLQSWISNEQFFLLGTNTPAFFGTQLVLLSRQFSVIAETVNEVRFALNSVFIGPAERQTLLLQFEDRSLPAMFVEDMLQEVEDFVTSEGPRLLQDGGKISVSNNILPVIKKFKLLVRQAHKPSNLRQLPDGYRTVRVQRSLDDLHDQIRMLIELVMPVRQQLPEPIEGPEQRFGIANVTPASASPKSPAAVTIVGAGFEPGVQASFVAISGSPALSASTTFLSENLAVAYLSSPVAGTYSVQVSNPSGRAQIWPVTFTVG